MEAAQAQVAPKPSFETEAAKTTGWFVLHTAVVYASAHWATPWLAGWLGRTLIPHLRGTGIPPMSAGPQLLFSHLFVLSFVPAAIAGSLNARFRQRSGCWVWIPPAVLVAIKVFSYPHSMLGESHPGIEHYFGSVYIPEYNTFMEMARQIGPWTESVVDQLDFTAPFYAGIGYAVAAWASMRWRFYSLGQQEAEV